MFCYILLFLTVPFNFSFPTFLDGKCGFYTTTPSFDRTGQVRLILDESYGTKQGKFGEENVTHNETNLCLGYTPFSYLTLITGINYFSMEREHQNSFLAKVKIPFLSLSIIKSSISPIITFVEEKTYFMGNIDFEITPFKRKNLPPFVFGNSMNIGRRNSENFLQYSSLLTLDIEHIQPFIEFYTDFCNSSLENTRFCSGLCFTIGNFALKPGIEFQLNDYPERDFDYRITGGINYLFDTRRKPVVELHITVMDSENETPIPATIEIKGKEVEEILDCKTGECVFENLTPGIYTIGIENPDYKKFIKPFSIKDKSIEKTYKLIKKEKGNNSL